MERPRDRRGVVLVLMAMLGGCAGDGPPDPDRPLQLQFEYAPEPEAFSLEAPAVRDRAEGADGMWAVVADLARPERARIVNVETGAEAVVALFSGRSGQPVRLSNAAADALGLEDGPTAVRVTALRNRASIDTTGGRF